MTTWGQLKADLLNMISRPSLSTSLGMYVRLAEARINRDVKCRTMERGLAFDIVAEGTAAGGLISVDLQAQAGSSIIESVDAVLLGLTTGENCPLQQVNLKDLIEQFQNTRGGTPKAYALSSNYSGNLTLLMTPVPTEETYVTIYFTVRFELDTTDDNSTNWLLRHHYDVYLNALASAACAQMQDFERQGAFDVNYKRAVAEVKDSENLARIGPSTWGGALGGEVVGGRYLP